MSEFWKAGSEIEDIVKELIPEYHGHLVDAEFCFVYKDKASQAEIEAGHVATIKKVSGVWKTLTEGKDFVILITYALWNELSTVEQRAMIDMALESAVVKLDKDGNEKLTEDGRPEFTLKAYDVVGHSAVIKRYGLDVFSKIGECARAAMATDTSITNVTPDEVESDEQPATDKSTGKTRKAKAGSQLLQ
jgi:hypothetical protein